MKIRKFAIASAAVVIAIIFPAAAGAQPARGKANAEKIVVEGHQIDADLQRYVPYTDLNLASIEHQKQLRNRIEGTANRLCRDLNPFDIAPQCVRFAVGSTRAQVAEAISRAKLRMAGIPAGPDVAITMLLSAQ